MGELLQQLQQLQCELSCLDISNEVSNRIPLEDYFPQKVIIYEYNAAENKTVKSTSLNQELKEWLRNKLNYNFVFQCLLCNQEMNFYTAFCHGNWYLNRSHLLTSKHKKNVAGKLCVGVLFLCSQKFSICTDKDFRNGKIFDIAKKVTRKNMFIDKNKIQNQVFCSEYKMYNLDPKTKQLSLIDERSDMVTFMRDMIRPLFLFNCLVCDVKAENFSAVVSHLLGKKHIKKEGGMKSAIISIRDFNIFVACDVNKITSFLYLDHLNSFLEEIVIASDKTIVISGCYSNQGKKSPDERDIKINVNPIKLPDGRIKNDSIRIKSRHQNFISGEEEEPLYNELLSAIPFTQKNVTIYEFSTKNLMDDYMDNMLCASFSAGCRMYCSRCKIPIPSIEALQGHLTSLLHNRNIRGNQQVGFMCHVCKVFFIELKGDKFFHSHNSRDNQNIITRINELYPVNSIEYRTPIYMAILNIFSEKLSYVAEPWKFSCLACSDVTKQKLMYLSSHEISTTHKNLTKKCLFTYCEYCNVVYIDKELTQTKLQFKFHFASHLSETNTGIIKYTVNDSDGGSFNTEVDCLFLSTGIRAYLSSDKVIQCQKLSISFSRYCIQFLDPGITSEEFIDDEKWNNNDFSKYIQVYELLTGNSLQLFDCSTCNTGNINRITMMDHLFVSVHQRNQLYLKNNFLKICDVCNLLIISDNLKGLQKHFTGVSHLKSYSRITGSLTFEKAINKVPEKALMKFSKSNFIKLIDDHVEEIRDVFRNRKNILENVEKDSKLLLATKFPSISVTYYGSRVSGLALEKSDCDIYLGIGNEHLDEAKKLFESDNQFFNFEVCLSDSTVPLIRAKHKQTGITCDFNLNTGKPYTSKIIKIYIDMDDRVLYTLAAVRYWADFTNLRNTNIFSSHAITWLVLFYLMQPDVKIIPNVTHVIERCGGLENICFHDLKLEWNERNQINKNKTWLDLLEGFFLYYSLTKFSEYKLYPSSGLVIPWNDADTEDRRPMFMKDAIEDKRNILYLATKEISEKLAAISYLWLHLPWRCDDQS